MMKKLRGNPIINYIQIAIGSLLYAVAVSLFLDPNALAPGGVTGIAMILSRITSVPTGTWILLINIPILLVGLWRFCLHFLLSTIYCISIVSVFTNELAKIDPITEDRFLACVVGGTILAVGIGLIFKAKSTTGGTDIIVKLLRLKFPHMKTGGLFLSIDAVIVACSALVLKDVEVALYAGVCIFLISRVLDFVLYGHDEAKLIYIISDNHEHISKRLLEEVDVGVTYVEGIGAYSGKDKKVIMCAVKKPLAPKAEDVVREEDPQAFMIVTSAMEIYGEGHKSYFTERL
jgi:uncharacterized membrane-anchored protein YitT (DUF2179 family)